MTLNELETTIRSHLNDEGVFDVVLVTSSACTQCGPIKQMFGTLNSANTNFHQIEFEGLPTLFALPSVPSIAVFYMGNKIYEAVASGNINAQRITDLLEVFKSGSFPGPIVLT